jgi:YbgC/YbaW family acyl-CoA thioester hydrolase
MHNPFPFCVDVAVRGYEVDSFGHVNNAVYLQWLEHARWEMGHRSGLAWVGQDILPVVRHLTLDYRTETRLGDALRICMWPRSIGQTSFVMGSSIRIVEARQADDPRRGKLAMAARQAFTCVRRGEGKVSVPDAWRAYFPAADPGDAYVPPEA